MGGQRLEVTSRILREEPEVESRRSTSADVGRLRLENGKSSIRQRKILETLVRSQKAQVSDFIKILPNITKRTIRRDLDDLLKKGKVIRVGEWNQVFYKIADRTEIPIISMS
jgi:predicted HTH transcriptional regulator